MARLLVIVAALALVPTASSAPSHAFTLGLSYTETNQGTGNDTIVGIRAKGSMKLTVAGTKAYSTFARGVPYTVRYDMVGNVWTGYLVARLGPARLGSVCLRVTLRIGAFKAGDHFPPATGTFTTIGGTGEGAALRVTGAFRATDVRGQDVLAITAKGALSERPPVVRPLTKACADAQKP